jgi:hypothetical protein
MSELIKARMLSMIDNELKEVSGDLSNNRIWRDGSETQEDSSMFEENMCDLVEYEEMLLEIREKVAEDKFNV